MKVWLVLFSSRPQGNLKALFFSFCIHKKKDLALSFIAQLYYNTLPSFSYFLFFSFGWLYKCTAPEIISFVSACVCLPNCRDPILFSFCLYLIFFYMFLFTSYIISANPFFYWFVRPLRRVFSHIFG